MNQKTLIRYLPSLLFVSVLSACSSSSSDSSSADNTGDSIADVSTDGGTESDGSTGNTNNPDNITGDMLGGDTTDTVTAGNANGDTTSTEDTSTEETAPDDNGNNDNNTNEENNNAATPVEVNLIRSATPPILDAENNVSWSFDAIASDLEVVVQPFVEMPLASNGRPARWNDLVNFDRRLFVVDEQDGRVYEITNGQAVLWFDIGEAIQTTTGRSLNIDNSFHGGVRSIAFHPEFLTNGKLYVSLMEDRPSDTANHFYISDAAALNADSVLVEWTAFPNTFDIDPGSYREVFRVGVPEFDHPIKQIAFNTNAAPNSSDHGLLYIAHGDGSVESSISGSGQNNDALGKILRIDPLETNSENYSIPEDNPFVEDASLPSEVFSYGHRNPHHLSFTTDGQLIVTEDGRDNIDEVNLISSGQNYGWPEREGSYVHSREGQLATGISVLPDNDALTGFVYPAVQFGHSGVAGNSFVAQALGGGHAVENGSLLSGQFFYIDFPVSGILFHVGLNDILQANTTGTPDELTVAQPFIANIKFDDDSNPDTEALDSDLQQIIQSAPGYVSNSGRLDIRIERGPDGELYLMSKRNNMIYSVANSSPDF